MVIFVVVKPIECRQHFAKAVNPTANNKNILSHINLVLRTLVSFYHRLVDYQKICLLRLLKQAISVKPCNFPLVI